MLADPTRPPTGCRVRSLTTADAHAVYEIVAAAEEVELGERSIDEEDIVGDWQRPSFDVTTQAVGVTRDGGGHAELVAYAEVFGGWRADAHVLPDHQGRGIGTWLAGWIQDEARRQGSSIVGMPVPAGSVSDRLLEGLGFFVRWTSWVLAFPEGVSIERQPLPTGFTFHDLDPADERLGGQQAYRLIDDAFNEWPDRTPSTYGDWAAGSLLRPGFEPWQLRLVTDPHGEVVGACLLILSGGIGYVDQLAVRRDHRGLGLARALLADAFETARAHGATRSELSTDSRTGALGLYERVGMRVVQTWVHRAMAV